jgi:small conductance mechanosensitive channel
MHWLNAALVATILKHGVRIALIIIGGAVARFIAHKMIDRGVRRVVSQSTRDRTGTHKISSRARMFSDERREQRIGALASLARSAVTFILLGIVILMVLSELGFNTNALLAGTSIVGVAVALGIRTVLQDVIAGIFMLMEDQIGMGDYVKLLDVDGVVEEVGLRLTELRDAEGTIWYVRNGDISKVANYTQGSGKGPNPDDDSESDSESDDESESDSDSSSSKSERR